MGPRAPGVDQWSRVTQALDLGLAGSTSYPWRLGPVPEASQCRPDVLGVLSLSPRIHGVD